MARRALGPATLAVVQAVAGSLAEQDHTLVVACSGGADSLALAFAASHVAGPQRCRGAVVVDHGLQTGSAAQAARAREVLLGWGYDDVAVLPVRVDQASPSGPEAAAREARYAALAGVAADRRATVLLGHTLDDQAETVLLGLGRGSGTRSLAGMRARNGHLLRPLLTVRRADTQHACAELGVVPWQDPHNADRRYARVRVRLDALPALQAALGPGVVEALARTAALAADDADLLDRLAAEARLRPDDPVPDDRVPDVRVGVESQSDGLDAAALAGQPAPLRRRIIRSWLTESGVGDLAMVHVLAVERLVTHWHGQREVALPGCSVRRAAGRLTLG